MRAQAVQAPTKSDVGNVNDVGLKDVPLRSLFPEEPAAPRPVRRWSAASTLPSAGDQCGLLAAGAQRWPILLWLAASKRCQVALSILQHKHLPRLAAAAPAHVAGSSAAGAKLIRRPSHLPRMMQGAPKLKVAIVGSGLAGLSTAVELLDQVRAQLGCSLLAALPWDRPRKRLHVPAALWYWQQRPPQRCLASHPLHTPAAAA